VVKGAFILLAAVALAQQPPARDAKFSHRAALEKGAKCLDCHAATAKSADAKLLFNHKLHLALGNIAAALAAAIDGGKYLSPPGDIRKHLNTKDACAACHRGLHQSDALSKTNLPQMADCLVCHDRINPPFSCEKCHTAAAASLKPATHTPEYLDLHTTAKMDKPSCKVCHGVNFQCMGCH
jgi:hypothetical protein